MTLLEKVKANLILQHDKDDALIEMYITAAISYAESYQHIKEGTYLDELCLIMMVSNRERQLVISIFSSNSCNKQSDRE